MNWNSFADFAQMGGYGMYVWGSYAVTLAALAFEVSSVVLRQRRTLRRLQTQSTNDRTYDPAT